MSAHRDSFHKILTPEYQTKHSQAFSALLASKPGGHFVLYLGGGGGCFT